MSEIPTHTVRQHLAERATRRNQTNSKGGLFPLGKLMESPCSPLKCSSETIALEGPDSFSMAAYSLCLSSPHEPWDTGSQQDRVWEKREDATGQARLIPQGASACNGCILYSLLSSVFPF